MFRLVALSNLPNENIQRLEVLGMYMLGPCKSRLDSLAPASLSHEACVKGRKAKEPRL